MNRTVGTQIRFVAIAMLQLLQLSFRSCSISAVH